MTDSKDTKNDLDVSSKVTEKGNVSVSKNQAKDSKGPVFEGEHISGSGTNGVQNRVARPKRTVDTEQDQTRVTRPSKSTSSASDQTQIARPKKQKSTADDQTQIARPKKQKSTADDQTQIARPKKQNSTADDQTRIVRPKKQNSTADDQTRIVQPRTEDSLNDKTKIDGPKKSSITKKDSSRVVRESDSIGSKTKINTIAPIPTSDISSGSKPTVDGGLLKQRFVLEKVLGAGGMGVVYKAKDLVKVEAGDKEPYLAIKVLNDEFKEHPEAFIALQRESRKTQRIAHPNIVNVHDFDKDGDTVFMTMEYLEGKPLDQLIRQYKSTGLPSDEAQNIIKNICRALIYAHDQNIIHSDFKPGNIFVTDRGVTKVFDFGIARAVAKAEHLEESIEDRTIFDAGDLGALTPSYASFEMLDGMEPDIRDDIYALGCVAYELFTGSHPFNKVPADEAKRQNLKAKRINHITRRQWKAIEKALSFEREDRVASVKEFLNLMSKVDTSYKLPIAVFVSAIVFTFVYFSFLTETPTEISETEIRSEVEYRIRLENYRSSLSSLVDKPDFSGVWEESIWSQFQGVRKLLEASEHWLGTSTNIEFKNYVQESIVWMNSSKKSVFNLYWERIQKTKEANEFTVLENLITNAYRYTEDHVALDLEMQLLKEAVAAQEKIAEERRKEKLAKENLEREKNEKLVSTPTTKTTSPKKIKAQQFDIALSNVQEQLKCQSNKLNMRNLDTAIQKLRSVDRTRYRKLEGNLVSLLTNCISQIAKLFPERAVEFKKHSLRIFPNNKSLAAIVIVPRDPCDRALAGLGARGKRATCKDPIPNLTAGPDLVVIPGKSRIKTFALGKHEVSVAEWNVFCKNSKSCTEIKSDDPRLPATGMSVQSVEKYLQWLSKKTKRKYRLPTKNEWVYAAAGRRVSLDPNRNCKLNTRGIKKGDRFVRSSIGAQNSWGLINYVGNASEWVYDKGRKLVAVGGSYNDPMEQCNISTYLEHNGNPDVLTGFRVLRELK